MRRDCLPCEVCGQEKSFENCNECIWGQYSGNMSCAQEGCRYNYEGECMISATKVCGASGGKREAAEDDAD